MERREFLGGLGIGGCGFVAACTHGSSTHGESMHSVMLPADCDEPSELSYVPWADPSAWQGGQVASATQDGTIIKPVLLSASTSVKQLTIAPGGALKFEPNNEIELQATGSIIVHGFLLLRPASVAVRHTITFKNITESNYVGSGGAWTHVTDVGLWVEHCGVLRAEGTARDGWNRTGTSTTWLSTDEVLTAPQAVGDFSNFAAFSPGGTLPAVTYDGVSYPTEAFNLTRNVIIQGEGIGTASSTNNRRAHVMFHMCERRQSLRFVLFRHLGPRSADHTQGILGRYAVHFHQCMDGSRGSVVEGVVVRDCGNHAFVPHASHGIVFKDCVAYNCFEDAYWWDKVVKADESHDTTYAHCAAFYIRCAPVTGGFRLAAFHLGHGERNQCVDCVAAGTQGVSPGEAAGFSWPDISHTFPGVWDFHDCVSHNNTANGLFVWQNNTRAHVIRDFVAYRNGCSGISHGAYHNDYSYRDVKLYENARGLILHAQSQLRRLEWLRVVIDCSNTVYTGGPTTFTGQCMSIGNHSTPAVVLPQTFIDCRFRPSTGGAPVLRMKETTGAQSYVDFIRARVGADEHELDLADFQIEAMLPLSEIRVEWRNGTAFQITAAGQKVPLPDFALTDPL